MPWCLTIVVGSGAADRGFCYNRAVRLLASPRMCGLSDYIDLRRAALSAGATGFEWSKPVTTTTMPGHTDAAAAVVGQEWQTSFSRTDPTASSSADQLPAVR